MDVFRGILCFFYVTLICVRALGGTVLTEYCKVTVATDVPRVACNSVPSIQQLRHDLSALNVSGPIKLTIQRTNLTILPECLFQNLSLSYLSFPRCNLQSLHEDCFFGLDDLEQLDLSRNSLTAVPSAVGTLRSLKMFYMTHNQVTSLGTELSGLSLSLRKIVLSWNMISSIHEDALKDMKNLLRFAATDNRIKHIPDEMFCKAPKLQQIDLRRNLIETVEKAFDGLPHLHVSFVLCLHCNEHSSVN